MNIILRAIPIGVWYVMISALGFAALSVCVKLVSFKGIPLFEIVAARALISVGLSYWVIKRKKLSVWGNNKKLLILRGTVGTLALACVFYATAALPLAEATILQYLYPVFTMILAIFFLNEKLQKTTLICVTFCIVGVVFVVNPELLLERSEGLPLFDVGIALLGALLTAVAYIIVKKLSATDDASVIVFYFPLIALPISLGFLSIENNFVMPDLSTFFLLILVGIFTQIGQVGLTKALQTEKASRITPYSYIQVVFAIIFGVIVFHESPSMWTIMGSGLILLGVLVNVIGHSKHRNLESQSVG